MKLVYRPMEASDVVVGQKFIAVYNDGVYRGKIEEVINPNAWNAFIADDGCRYGLDGSFVKVKK